MAVELSGGLAVLCGFQARLAAAGLAVWCIVTALVGHTNFADADAQIQVMKNAADKTFVLSERRSCLQFMIQCLKNTAQV